ncbi:alpha/beta hydrolase [Rhodococcus sp. ACPA4]|uniref:alpha/beta hydrolase n=1 Tax=Rhodococcus sp. ACPA4 TaxID=2028571 RepID=UPI00211CA364|nr:lipase family protein [Rhodococcus sp. ACPA4]
MGCSSRVGAALVVVCTALSLNATVARAEEPIAGSVVSHMPLAAATLPIGAAVSEQIVYRTLRTADRQGISSGSIFLPEGAPPTGGWPVISYAHGTVGSADRCAPSVAGFYETERRPIERWLAEGYAVVATDYSGLGTEGALAYLDGPAAGANAIDIVRAAHEVYGDVLDERWMVAGLSEGGHAAYFAGHEASSRAPELDFRGTVVVAGPTHLEGLFPLGGPLFPELGIPGLVVYVLYLLGGIDDQRPEENVRQYLSPLGISWMEKAATQCAVDIGKTVASERVPLGALFSQSLWTPHIYELMREMLQVPVDGYDRPLRIVQSTADTTLPIPFTWAQLVDLRSRGTQFEYQEIQGVPHSQSVIASMDQTVEFTQRVLR